MSALTRGRARPARDLARRGCAEALAVSALLLGWCGGPAHAHDLLIRRARLVDGTGAPPQEQVSILIRGGRIAAIGPDLAAEQVPVLDADGATVVPGLIDAHVHLSFGPGSLLRDPLDRPALAEPEALQLERWSRTWGALLPRYLRAYLACGVTTVLDAGALPFVVRRVHSWLAAGNPGPRYLTLGPFVRPPGGYPDPIFGAVSSVDEVEAKLDLLVSLHAVGVKVPIERGFSPFRSLPLHPPEILRAIVAGAERRGLPVYVHATEEEQQRAALDAGAHALVHTLIGSSPDRRTELSDEFARHMQGTGAYQMTTLSVLDSQLTFFRPQRLRDPLLALVVPEVELASARDRAMGQAAQRALIAQSVPWLPGFLQGLVARVVFTETSLAAGLERSQRAIRRLHDAGVPIVVGSDSPFHPSAVYTFHGPTTLREMELIGEAGLSPHEVIQAATRVAAEMLGLAGEIGTVEVGKRADLMIVGEDPLADLRALRAVRWTVRDGEARTPGGWITD